MVKFSKRTHSGKFEIAREATGEDQRPVPVSAQRHAGRIERLVGDCRDVFQLVGLYFHTHAMVKVRSGVNWPESEGVLTQRERQCLAWAARGKTVADTAILVGIAPRTVVFHLEKARQKLNALSIAQCVAEAMRRGLLP